MDALPGGRRSIGLLGMARSLPPVCAYSQPGRDDRATTVSYSKANASADSFISDLLGLTIEVACPLARGRMWSK